MLRIMRLMTGIAVAALRGVWCGMLRIMRLMTGIAVAALRGVCQRGKRAKDSRLEHLRDPKYPDIVWPDGVSLTTSSPPCWCSAPPEPKPFRLAPGGEVEAWSAHAPAWFPAVIVACSDDPHEPIVVRLKGNSVHDKLRRGLVRPLRRLAAARRECGSEVDYGAYDRDNIRHIRECAGCRECAGVRQYYIPCRKCQRTIHRELLDGTWHGHETGRDGLCWLCHVAAPCRPLPGAVHEHVTGQRQ